MLSPVVVNLSGMIRSMQKQLLLQKPEEVLHKFIVALFKKMTEFCETDLKRMDEMNAAETQIFTTKLQKC